MWWSIIPTVIKTGAEIYKNHKQSELFESEAERRYFERMARGEIEYKRDVYEDQQKGWKDELVLIIVCLPIVLLAWSLFSGDPLIQQKLDLFFDYFNKFPEFYKWLVVGIFGAIYGLKPTLDIFNKK
jgi:uncharacterized ion transporter superfamily protein YfcC